MWLRKADFVTGLVLAAIGLTAFVLSLDFGWDLSSVQRDGWYTAPGLVPAAAALLLVLLGCSLSYYAFKDGGGWKYQDLPRLKPMLASPAFGRVALTAVLLMVYVFGLVGRVHFILASFLFLAAFMLLFKATAWWKVLVISAVASTAIGLVFERLARIPLP